MLATISSGVSDDLLAALGMVDFVAMKFLVVIMFSAAASFLYLLVRDTGGELT